MADRMRPVKLSQVVGQEELTGKDMLLNRIVEEKLPLSLIFWGPPGSGKTTLARIIANETKADFIELSAVSAAKKDVMQVIERARNNQKLEQPTILFVDEIHRFNKAQQDAFLPYVENGTIHLIGATTENPSFEVISALLSRSRVIVLKPLSKKALSVILENALTLLSLPKTKVSAAGLNAIAELAGGDARSAINLLELSLDIAGKKIITPDIIKTIAQKQLPRHDKSGESHYNLISAFIKSLRGSNATASFYYLARLIQGGEDPKFIARRMIVFASEDIGMAAPAALNLAVSAFLSVERIGLPECEYNLYHCAAVLAKAPKSRTIAESMSRAKNTAEQYPNLAVPLALRNAPTKLMKNLGYGRGYAWKPGFQPSDGFLPDEIKNIDLFIE